VNAALPAVADNRRRRSNERCQPSSARFARTSWTIPIAELETRTPRKSASRQSPKKSVRAPKTARIRLKTVKTLARTMLA
jgi:hypothetical protein